MDLRKYMDLFLAEAREHVEQAGEAVTRLEQEPGDTETVHALFRHGHSIKGMAASMGFTPIAQVSHALEDLFDGIRRGASSFGAPAASACLAALDAVSEALDRVEAGEEPGEKLLEHARRLREAAGAPPQGPAAPPGASPEAGTGAPEGPESPPPPGADGLIYNAEITLSPQAPMPSARALVLYKKLEAMGHILFASPTREEIAAGTFSGTLLVQFASTTAAAALRSELLGPEVEAVLLSPFMPASEGTPRPAAPPPPRNAPPTPPSTTVRIRTDVLDRFVDHLGQLVIHESRLRSSLGSRIPASTEDAFEDLHKTLERLRGDLMSLRMIPFEHIAPRFVRSVRNLGDNLDKRVALTIEGRDVKLDRSILEELVDPINHILRNAVDHGIEAADERRERGKAPEGSITIRNTAHSDSVTVEIADDGRGMDPDRIRRTAVERGFLSREDARGLSDPDALMLVTTPGFSTAEHLTEISGRGVGMDVVRTRIENLGGRLRIDSRRGDGTRLLLRLPLTIAVIHGFLVRSGEQVFAVPVTSVQRTVEVRPERVRTVEGRRLLSLDEDDTVEVRTLESFMSDAANGTGALDGASRPALIYRGAPGPLALLVDGVLGKRDLVVKPLRSPLENLREYTGATVLEDGRIALILDLPNLVGAAGVEA